MFDLFAVNPQLFVPNGVGMTATSLTPFFPIQWAIAPEAGWRCLLCNSESLVPGCGKGEVAPFRLLGRFSVLWSFPPCPMGIIVENRV